MIDNRVCDRPELQKLFSDYFFPYDLDEASPRDFEGSTYQSTTIASVRFTRTEMSVGFRGRRAPRARGERPSYVISFAERGACINLDGRRVARYGAGDAIMINSQAALYSDVTGGSTQLGLNVDAALLRSIFPNCDDLCLRPISTQDGAAAVLRSTVSALWAQQHSCGASAAASVMNAIIHMVVSAFREQQDIPDFGSHAMGIHYVRLRDKVAEHLTDPDFSIERLSSETGLSRSYIYAIFAQANMTLGRLVMTMRLERSRAMLADRSMLRRSIADIAFSVGFQDQAHFSRRFSEQYGRSPRTFRNEMATGLSDMIS